MTITKDKYGYTIVSAIVDGYRTSRVYIGYTKKQAKEKFIKDFKIK